MAERTNFERHTARTETRREIAREQDGAPGYSSNGESEFSRHVARGGRAEQSAESIMRATASMSRLDQLIFKNCRQLVRLEERISTETDPIAVAHHIVNHRKKLAFINTLRAEQRAGRK